ncbi:methyltransferase domain-containing protein [Sporichthya sp.]|uniref:class I SAM-dependent methyltransferase n=1 Tax=Sporichthya sp. TaxID=65475 RepID=UPI0025E8F04A|nr:methyltransferase domain-containing protein [Sporichthya sp.]
MHLGRPDEAVGHRSAFQRRGRLRGPGSEPLHGFLAHNAPVHDGRQEPDDGRVVGTPSFGVTAAGAEVMDKLSRGLMDGQLLTGILPGAGDLAGRLAAGARAADVGCGTGHALNLMARAFPASEFRGYDFSAEGIARARAEAAEWGLGNVEFEILDVVELAADPPFGVVFAFDAIHDQVDPVGVLAAIHRALEPGGLFLIMDTKASSSLENNLENPLAPMLYAVSTLHCMTVSLAHGGAGLGTMWGEERARQILADAGFDLLDVYDVPDDPMDSVYLSQRPPTA